MDSQSLFISIVISFIMSLLVSWILLAITVLFNKGISSCVLFLNKVINWSWSHGVRLYLFYFLRDNLNLKIFFCFFILFFIVNRIIFNCLELELLFPVSYCAGDDGAGPSRPTASGALLQGHPVLEGRPVRWKDIWGTPAASSLYLSSVIHISGEIEEPLILNKLSKLNGYLLFFDRDILNTINAAYTQTIQRELDQTAAVLLSAKLDCFIGVQQKRYIIYILQQLFFSTFSYDPEFLFRNKNIFDESILLTLQRYDFPSNNKILEEVICSLEKENTKSPIFVMFVNEFNSKFG